MANEEYGGSDAKLVKGTQPESGPLDARLSGLDQCQILMDIGGHYIAGNLVAVNAHEHRQGLGPDYMRVRCHESAVIQDDPGP
jgi:hypothetical protein